MTTLYQAVLVLSEIGFTQSQSCLERVGSLEKTGGALRNVISITYVVFYRHNIRFVSQSTLKQTVSGWPSGLGADLRPPSLRGGPTYFFWKILKSGGSLLSLG